MNKTHSFILPFVLISLFWSFSFVYSQGLPPPGGVIDFLNLKTLTEQQKQILIDERQKIKQSRIDFRNSLTKEQKAILTDSKLSKEQRRLRLVASFSKNQKNLIRKELKAWLQRFALLLLISKKRKLEGLKRKIIDLKREIPGAQDLTKTKLRIEKNLHLNLKNLLTQKERLINIKCIFEV